MKSVFVEGRDLDETWYKLLYELYQHGRENKITAGSYAGATRLEFDYAAGTIKYPTTRPLAPTLPEGVPVPTTDKDIENYFVNYLMNGELADNEHYKYSTWIVGGEYHLPKVSGRQLRGTDGSSKLYDMIYDLTVDVPNQVEWIIKHYKEKGFGNNHCYIQVGYPESSFAYDIPYDNENERQTSPCLRGIDTHVKGNKLHMAVIFRSWALYSAWPENMGGITMLGEYIANELGIEMGSLSFSCLKLHAYDFEIKSLEARLKI